MAENVQGPQQSRRVPAPLIVVGHDLPAGRVSDAGERIGEPLRSRKPSRRGLLAVDQPCVIELNRTRQMAVPELLRFSHVYEQHSVRIERVREYFGLENHRQVGRVHVTSQRAATATPDIPTKQGSRPTAFVAPLLIRNETIG